jgi:hypothetical protein
MGRPRSHPRGLGVAFGPTLDPSRAGPMATPGPWGGRVAIPGSRGGLRASPRWPPQALHGHPRPLGGGRAATPGPWGGHPRGLGLARTWGWPSGQPFCPGVTHRQLGCHRRPRSTPTPTPPAGRPIGGDSGCGGSSGGLGWVGGDGEWGWVSAAWVYEFGMIGCFHPMVLWCAKLTC